MELEKKSINLFIYSCIYSYIKQNIKYSYIKQKYQLSIMPESYF